MPNRNERLLVLDTHIWIWLMNGEAQKLSSAGLSAITQASQHGKVGISAISVWEVGMLEAKGRVQLQKNCLAWVQEALLAPGTILLSLTPEIAVESSRLPGVFHGDPADRILAATTRILDATLVTKDTKLIEYSHQQHFLSVLLG